jgi:integrase/recombinase XerD
LLFKTYLCSGFRNREVATLDKGSVKAQDNKLGVKARPQYGFKPKNYECREVRIPASLMAELVAHMKKSKRSLVFPSKPHPKRPNYGGDKPDAHHLELCKTIAHRAGLNCGLCLTPKGESCADGPVCENWYLHKWRHTFATNSLRDGMDIKTLQTLLGHKNLSTTEKYLKALHVDDLADKVEASTIAGLVA